MRFYLLVQPDPANTGLPMGHEYGLLDENEEAPVGAQTFEDEKALKAAVAQVEQRDEALIEKEIERTALEDSCKINIVDAVKTLPPEETAKLFLKDDFVALADEVKVSTLGSDVAIIIRIKAALKEMQT